MYRGGGGGGAYIERERERERGGGGAGGAYTCTEEAEGCLHAEYRTCIKALLRASYASTVRPHTLVSYTSS